MNPLTAVLTFASLIGYAVLYTVWLKHVTPQNIVIGGAAGAAPPVLGWTAVTNSIDPHALLLFLIIFAWTPPHFWALAIARRDDYARAGIPMLPVAYGVEFTRLHILLYTILLVIVTLLPYLTGMSGLIYLAVAVVLGVAVHPPRARPAARGRAGAAADEGLPLLDQLPDAAVRSAARRPLPAAAALRRGEVGDSASARTRTPPAPLHPRGAGALIAAAAAVALGGPVRGGRRRGSRPSQRRPARNSWTRRPRCSTSSAAASSAACA